jgi:ABC-type glycerol-3-phosphate transport system substrate-binding protein
MTHSYRMTRRAALKTAAIGAALPLVHIRTGHAAGKVSIAFWDHWVPAGNDVMKKQCAEWGAKNQVDVQADFVTSVGSKNILTIAAEAQAKTGHDVQQFPGWEVQNHVDDLEPVDDVMKSLTDKYGPVTAANEYLAKSKGTWRAVPTSAGNQNKGPCGRISVLKNVAGLDVVKMYPPSADATPDAEKWTYDAMLKAAEACQKANMTLVSVWEQPPTRWTPPAPSSPHTARKSSPRKATSPLNPTRYVRCLSTRNGW